MSTEIDYTPFSGGLDYVTSALGVKNGRLSECQNFEQVFGKQGYRRMDGYERYDGRSEPSKASYSMLSFDAGTAAIAPGDIVTGAAASAKVVLVNITSGSWATSNAAGVLVLDLVVGAFVDNEAIKVSTVTKALANGVLVPGSISEPNNATYLQAVTAQRRTAIQAVPGSGSVLGVCVYRSEVYAVRNVADGTSATMWKSSATGWTSVKMGLYPGGTYKFEVANFSGASTTVAMFGCNGRGRLFKWDGTTFTWTAPIYGTQALSATSFAVGTGSKSFVLTTTARSYVAGQSVIIWSTANAANWMLGSVTSYTSGTNTLVVNVTSTGGSGTFTDWEIGLSDWRDKPFDLTSHRDHLFLAYPLGQLQTSNLGDPMTYTTTAALFGLGNDITGLVSLKGGVLAAFCRNKIDMISGSSLSTWSKQPHSTNSGARASTLQENAGNAIYLDDRGITTLQSTLSFGNFESSIFSRNIKPYLDAAMPSTIGSRLVKSKYQYRLYFSSGEVLSGAILSPNATLEPTDVSFLRQKLDHVPTCFGEGDMSTTETGYFFGTSDGYVMREDAGTSFDGSSIKSAVRLHFNHFKRPSNRKRFRKLVMELESDANVTISFRQQFDYSDGVYSAGGTQAALAGGGTWNTDGWDTFYWSLPLVAQAEANIDGVGKNMSLLLWHESSSDKAFVLQGLLTHYSILGLAR